MGKAFMSPSLPRSRLAVERIRGRTKGKAANTIKIYWPGIEGTIIMLSAVLCLASALKGKGALNGEGPIIRVRLAW